MLIKILIYTFLLIITDLFPQWNQVTLPIYTHYGGVYFFNREVGWICGNGGTLFKTNDGGLNWEIRTAGTNLDLIKIKFANDRIGWIVGQNGLILKTTDGGNSWIQKVSNTTADIISLSVVDSLYLWASTFTGAFVLHSFDGGETWTVQKRFNFNYLRVSFVSRNVGYVAGHSDPPIVARQVYKTTDGGKTWNFIHYDGSQSLDIFFIDENYGWLTGTYVLMTTNGGNNWIVNPLVPNSGYSSKVFILKHGVGWVTTYSGGVRIFYTSDSGQNWMEQYNSGPLYSTGFKEIFFVDSAYGWAVGNSGMAFYTLNGGGIVKVDENGFSENAKDYCLYQNYPNPFNPSTMISWHSPVSGWQTLKIYDILGNEIATLVDEYREAGRYEVEFNAVETRSGVSLPSGVYLYKLSIGNFYKIKKMLYLR